jgi:biopolymer transport protein ExbB
MSSPPLLDLVMLWRIVVFAVLMLAAWELGPQTHRATAQQPAGETIDPADQAERLAEAERRAQAALAEPRPLETPPKRLPTSPGDEKINLWELYLAGGVLMIPITLMSFLAVAVGFERLLGLRRGKVLAPRLLRELMNLAAEPGGLDPRQAFWFCQQCPSTASNVIRAMLLKVGRPVSEIEHAMAEANEREAAKLYSNVRWLHLCANVTPLIGLLGTVQGMIQTFFVTAHLPIGADKAESLAQGIYVALVTTFGGLVVAIPAAILAHWFEGRIQRLFRELDEALLVILPQLQRLEGKVQVSSKNPWTDFRLEWQPAPGPTTQPTESQAAVNPF